MAYAPHTNTDVQHRWLQHDFDSLPLLIGCFRYENALGAFFEYAERCGKDFPDETFAPGFGMQLYTIDGPRLCRVLKTVAVVVVGETADGEPITERWPIAQHRAYPTEWVGARA